MGFLDKILGREEEEEDEFFDEDEFEDEFDDEFEDEEEFEEEEVREWENAYDFSKDILTNARGFSSMGEFVAKAAVMRMNRSNRYRDRIAMGKETMELVSDTVAMAEGIGGGGATNWEDAAEQLEGAVRVKEQMDQMVDKEERMVNEFLGIARDGIDVLRDRTDIAPSDVSTSTRHSEEDI